ncbi:LIM/homeobox protein lim-7-like isoform X2 [Oscarella lobularis]|uniref:LIM/homeobox protein lim-7-like isoform X2 n=1 Tax=Oscarella lobularis TaxID=121494 RepID=UPI0033134DB0
MTHYGYLEGCVMKQAAAAVATPAAAAAAAATTCAGCRRPIRDQYIFRVLPDLEWHADCLRCCECQAYLDETCTCFVRHGRVYCKSDYLSCGGGGGGGVSAARCAKCTGGFGTTEYVTKVAGRIYHVNCFACSLCDRRLVTGEKFYLSPSTNEPICDDDHVAVATTSSQASSPSGIGGDMNIADDEKDNNKSPASTSGSSSAQANSVKESSSSTFSQPTKTRKSKKGSDKPTRVRTVLTEKQLHTLRTCYAANPRPDALMKEQLCEMTGLSPRVIRVWFQNKRCKDKKKSLMVGGGGGGNSRMQDSPPLGQILQPAMTKEPGPPPPLPPPSFPQAESNSMPPLPGLPNIPSSPGLTAVACQSPTVPMPPTPTLPPQRQYQHMATIEQELHQSPHTPTTPASCHYAGYPPMPSPLATPPAAGYFAMPSPTVTMPPSPHPYLTQQQSSWAQFASRATTTTTAHPRAAYSGEIYRDHPIF